MRKEKIVIYTLLVSLLVSQEYPPPTDLITIPQPGRYSEAVSQWT